MAVSSGNLGKDGAKILAEPSIGVPRLAILTLPGHIVAIQCTSQVLFGENRRVAPHVVDDATNK
jgi:hypothetical protein